MKMSKVLPRVSHSAYAHPTFANPIDDILPDRTDDQRRRGALSARALRRCGLRAAVPGRTLCGALGPPLRGLTLTRDKI